MLSAITSDVCSKVRRSRTLVFFTTDSGLEGYNYLTGDEFVCDGGTLEFLRQIDEWTDDALAARLAGEHFGMNGHAALSSLEDMGCLNFVDSERARQEDDAIERWRWNATSAILHFTVTDRPYCTRDEQIAFQRKKMESNPSPPLVTPPNSFGAQIALPAPSLEADMATTMAARRTEREPQSRRVTAQCLSDCLHAGLAITDWTENAVTKLPLKMTPSGGARNPYDAFIYVRDVDGIEPGYYHYAAEQHLLEFVSHVEDETGQTLLGGQEWAANPGAIIFLCADFERNMWKYEGDDNAYRVVLMEAGHIGQNIMLAATKNGMSACPSAAIAHGLLHQRLGFDRPTLSGIYALALN